LGNASSNVWKNFIQSNQDVQVVQAVLIVARRPAGRNHLRVIIVIEVIVDLPTPVEEDE
jgi:hypothetical protein